MVHRSIIAQDHLRNYRQQKHPSCALAQHQHRKHTVIDGKYYQQYDASIFGQPVSAIPPIAEDHSASKQSQQDIRKEQAADQASAALSLPVVLGNILQRIADSQYLGEAKHIGPPLGLHRKHQQTGGNGHDQRNTACQTDCKNPFPVFRLEQIHNAKQKQQAHRQNSAFIVVDGAAEMIACSNQVAGKQSCRKGCQMMGTINKAVSAGGRQHLGHSGAGKKTLHRRGQKHRSH